MENAATISNIYETVVSTPLELVIIIYLSASVFIAAIQYILKTEITIMNLKLGRGLLHGALLVFAVLEVERLFNYDRSLNFLDGDSIYFLFVLYIVMLLIITFRSLIVYLVTPLATGFLSIKRTLSSLQKNQSLDYKSIFDYSVASRKFAVVNYYQYHAINILTVLVTIAGVATSEKLAETKDWYLLLFPLVIGSYFILSEIESKGPAESYMEQRSHPFIHFKK